MLKLSLENKIEEISSDYGLLLRGPALKNRLSNLIKDMAKIGNNYSPQIVVLIDEYDAPIVNLPKGSDLEQENIKVMKDFFMTLKSLNSYFKLTFITGVSKFSLSDVFSGANHLDDITIDQSADAMFGYTEGKIRSYFPDNIEKVRWQWSKDQGKNLTTAEVLKCMQSRYNGYKFYKKSASIYNPWSTLKFLKSGELSNYWYGSGPPNYY